jgi:hypothetical protein
MASILYHSTGWAGKYIALGYWRAFNSLGHTCELYGDWNNADGFDEAWEKVGKPDIVWCSQSQVHLLPLEKIKKEGVTLVVRANWYSQSRPLMDGGEPSPCSENMNLILHYASLIEHFSCQEFIDQYYDGWRDRGVRTISLPLAADTEIYQPKWEQPNPSWDMSYCGGYWPNKARDMDQYLLPLRNTYSIKVSGWGSWPIPIDRFVPQEEESEFYQMAKVCPCISEPHSKIVKYEVLERLFKVLASKAFCVSDYALAIPDYFEEDELCVAKTCEEFIEKVKYYIGNPSESHKFIEKGYNRTVSEHTYKHRVNRLLKEI